MNKVILLGRLTKDPEVRYTQEDNPLAVARFTLAVNRRSKDQQADFISCLAFGKVAEIVEKNLKKASQIAVYGRIRTDSYTNREGMKVYTTDVVVEEINFCGGNNQKSSDKKEEKSADTTMSIPDEIDTELPFDQMAE